MRARLARRRNRHESPEVERRRAPARPRRARRLRPARRPTSWLPRRGAPGRTRRGASRRPPRRGRGAGRGPRSRSSGRRRPRFAARFALFDWIGPMRWPAASGGSSGNFSSASWTRFSPNARAPAAWARRRSESGYVFPTATRRTLPARAPLRAAAAAIRPSTSARRAAISAARVTAAYPRRGARPRGGVESRVREGVGLAVLLARHVDDAEALGIRRAFRRASSRNPARCGAFMRYSPENCRRTSWLSARISTSLGARREREVEGREKAAPLRDVVRRGAERLRVLEPRGRPDPVGRRAGIPARRPVEVENEAFPALPFRQAHGIQ